MRSEWQELFVKIRQSLLLIYRAQLMRDPGLLMRGLLIDGFCSNTRILASDQEIILVEL